MLKDVVRVECLDSYRLRVAFEDGVEGVVDLEDLVPFVGVFAALRDKAIFGQAYVDQELGTVCWPTGADLDPDVLYAEISGHPVLATSKVSAPSTTPA